MIRRLLRRLFRRPERLFPTAELCRNLCWYDGKDGTRTRGALRR